MAVDLEQREPWMIRVTGRLSEDTGQELLEIAKMVIDAGRKEVTVELSGVDKVDSVGAAFLAQATKVAGIAGLKMTTEGARGITADYLSLFQKSLEQTPPAHPSRHGFLEKVGGAFFDAASEAKDFAGFAVESMYWTFIAPFERKGVRWSAVWDEMHEMGVRAIGVVFIINLLLGFILSVLSAAQLEQFGAAIFVADLVTIAFTREMAALMTAIIISARSGSAIAAELAAMTVQEEVDALKSMGFNTTQFLVTPKIMAMVISLPMLTIIAMFAGIMAGFLLGVFSLGISPMVWLNQTIAALSVNNILVGLGKSLCYAIVIVVVGCHNGLRTSGGSRGVGLATTRSVVMDIFFIIVVAMMFALFVG